MLFLQTEFNATLKPDFYYTSKKQEIAILVGVHKKSDPENKLAEYLDELEALTATAGAKTAARLTQNLD